MRSAASCNPTGLLGLAALVPGVGVELGGEGFFLFGSPGGGADVFDLGFEELGELDGEVVVEAGPSDLASEGLPNGALQHVAVFGAFLGGAGDFAGEVFQDDIVELGFVKADAWSGFFWGVVVELGEEVLALQGVDHALVDGAVAFDGLTFGEGMASWDDEGVGPIVVVVHDTAAGGSATDFGGEV